MDKITLNRYKAFMYTTLLPRQWFKNLFPNSGEMNSGRNNTKSESCFYAMPKYVVKVTSKQRKAANTAKVISTQIVADSISVFSFEYLAAKFSQLKAQVTMWYLDHTDMPFDANVKMSMAKTLDAIAVKNECISNLTLEQQEQIDRVFARELLSTLVAAVVTIVKEALTFLLAWIYYLIARPLYLCWLLCKNFALGGAATYKDHETIKHIKEKTFSEYWKYGVVLPVYRFFHKVIIGVPELIYGLCCFVEEKEIAKKLPEMFNSGIDTISESIGSSKTIVDSDNTITAKRPLLIAFSSIGSSMSVMLFTSKTMLFRRQGSSNSSIETSPTEKRKSAFEFEMNGNSPRHHSVTLL